MILKNIFFQLTVNDASKEYRSEFYNKSRHICNYIERDCFKPLKYQSSFFQGIGIELRYGYEDKFMDVEPYISPNKTLVIVLTLDKEKYDNIKTDEEYRQFLYKKMIEAFSKVENTNFEIPSLEILASFEKLKNNNFVNEWLFKKKMDKSRNIVAELHCSMNIKQLELILKIFQYKKEIFNKKIHQETTNNMVIRPFDDLKIESEKILIIGKRENIFKEFSFKELGIQ